MKIHSRSLPETRKRLKINWTLFVATLLALAILGPSIFFLHQAQLGRVASALKKRSEGFKDQQDWLACANSIDLFLMMDPQAKEQKVVLAEVLDEALPDDQAQSSFALLNRITAEQARALGVCELDESYKARESAIRKRLVQRLIQAGRFEDAMDHIPKMAGPALDASLLKSLALIRYSMALENRNHSFTDSTQVAIPDWLYSAATLNVVDLLLKSLIDNPGDIDISNAIAEVCLGNPEFLAKSQLANEAPEDLRDRAFSVMDKMLASNRDNISAWLAHYSVASRLDVVRAESDIRQALSMAPEDPTVLREAGNHFWGRASNTQRATDQSKKAEWLELAEKYLTQAIENGLTRDSRVYLGLGEVALARGNFDEAIQTWGDGARASSAPTALLWFRLAQAWAGKKDLSRMKETLTSMDEAIRVESSLLTKRGQTLISRMASQQWATYYAIQGDFVRAAKYLENIVGNDKEMDAENRSEMIFSLGLCYLRSGQYDRAVEALQDAAGLAPMVDERYRGLADALVGSNRLRDAIDRMENIKEKSGRDFVKICEIILDYQRRNLKDPLLWERFDAALKEASLLSPSDPYLIERRWLIEFLQLDSAIERASPEARTEAIGLTQKRLSELSDQFPESLELQRLIIEKLETLGFPEKARELFAKVESAKPTDPDVILIKIENLLKDGMRDEAKRLLDERIAQDPTNPSLQTASMRMTVGARKLDSKLEVQESFANNIAALSEAGRNLVESQIVVSDPSDESLLAAATKNWADNIEVIEEKLRKLEGLEGTEWRYLRARRLLVEYQMEGKSDISELEILSAYLVQHRASWNCTFALAAMVEDLKGNALNAIRDFNRAIRLGEQNIRVYERLAELMLGQDKRSELVTLIEKLGDRVNKSQRLSSIAIGISGKDQNGMLELARSGVESRPRDAMAWVWLAQVTELVSRGQPQAAREVELKKSEEAITRARELSENKSIPVFGAAFGLYLLTKQQDKIDALLSDLTNSTIDPTLKQLALADFYQVIERMDLAQEALLIARKTSKEPNAIDDRIARLLVAQGKQDDAIKLYKTLLTNLPEDGSLRRSYVTLLASRGTDEDWASISEVYTNEKVAENPDDRRLRAELLARKGQQKDLAQAQVLLESLAEDPKNRTDQDRFRLASIYIRNANLAEIQDAESPQVKQLLTAAGKQLAALCKSSQTPVEYLYAYGDFLIKQDRVVEANDIADRLNAQDSNHFATAVLRARLQKISGNLERAKTLIVSWKNNSLSVLGDDAEPSAKAEILANAGDALNELGATKEAEATLRQAFELDGRKGVVYIRSLARSEDKAARENAIRYLLEKLRKEKTPELARLLAGLLSVGEVSSELAQEGDEALSEVGTRNDNNAELLLSIADMWLAQKKSNRAIDAYRKIVKLRPNDVVALNNLAILLGEQPDGTQEALSLIDQAIRIAGKQPLLLDSKAAILMLANRLDEAIPILEIAASATNDPRVIFHLYLALKNANRNEEADRIKPKVNPNELRKSILTPDDQAALELFEKENPQ